MPSTYNSFNPRAHVGRDGAAKIFPEMPVGFNPRAHVGRDGFVAAAVAARTAVSIHAPTWGATVAFFANKALALFQSTRPRGARRSTAQPGSAVMNVSIHAPTWGATRYGHKLPRERMVSIHAPTWGATKLPTLQVLPACGFNPRAHVGRDKRPAGRWCLCQVSIHAPTWGATGCALSERTGTEVSIHAPTWGAT